MTLFSSLIFLVKELQFPSFSFPGDGTRRTVSLHADKHVNVVCSLTNIIVVLKPYHIFLFLVKT